MFRPARRLSVAAALPFACVLDMVFAEPASAHIKWFCAYDVASQPVGLENVLCPDLELLTGLSLPFATTSRSFSAPLARSSSSRSGPWAGSC